MSYAKSGVNTQETNSWLKEVVRPLNSSKGEFASILEFGDQTIMTCTDGVGTKRILAKEQNKIENLGQDLVAMCVNDLICHGAKPRAFLDYLASCEFDQDSYTVLIKSIHDACQEAGCELVGGETAIEPGVHDKNNLEMVGFAIGSLTHKSHLLPKQNMESGDIILGLKSSGFHANGYSLIRKICANLDIENISLGENNVSLLDLLLEPTRIYVKQVLPLVEKDIIKGGAHITGDGMKNISRIIPDHLTYQLDSWDWGDLFYWIQEQASLSDQDMLETFNCSIGFALIMAEDKLGQAQEELRKTLPGNEEPIIIGKLVNG